MVDVPVGEGSGGVGGIPTRYLLLGAGGLVVAFFFLRGKGSGGSDAETGPGSYGGGLGPNAALALGGLQSQVMQESGYLQELFTKQAQALGDQDQQQYDDLLSAIFTSGSGLQTYFGERFDTLQAGQESNLASVQSGQRGIFDFLARNFGVVQAQNWQIFQRASDPNWMPSGSDPDFGFGAPELSDGQG